MSLEKAILHRKEHRKPYYNGGAGDKSCRPGGDCPYCKANRMHKHRKQEAKSQMEDF